MLGIRAARMVDVEQREMIDNAAVIIDRDRIVEAGRSDEVNTTEGLEWIDLGDRTLMPGFVDAHSHITINPGLRGIIGQLDGLNEPAARQVLRGTRNLNLDLASGVTTMRIVGEVPYNDILVRDAINDGFIPGPRLLVSGRAITSSNGHGSLVPDWVVDGPDEMRRVVRQQLRMGCDFTKLIVTGRQYRADATEYIGFTAEEIAIAIEESHRAGSKVGAHLRADLDTGLRLCLELGLDFTDHVFPVDQESIDLFLQSGATAIPTYTVGLQTWVDWDALRGLSIADRLQYVRERDTERLSQSEFETALTARRVRWIRDSAPEDFLRAVAANVPFAPGTDAMHGLFAYELEVFVRWGLDPIDAIAAATIQGAEALGIQDETGSLAAGKSADIIAVDGDPRDDIACLGNVSYIMARGQSFEPDELLDRTEV
ncbi:MAG: amidohydrolase family protein [Thermomicrobiales bacterium]